MKSTSNTMLYSSTIKLIAHYNRDTTPCQQLTTRANYSIARKIS